MTRCGKTLIGARVLLALLVPGARAAVAQVRSGAAPVTTIDQLVADALERAPAIVAAAARKDAATGNALQAALGANPELMTSRRDEIGGMNAQTSVGISVPLELGRRGARMAVGDQEVARARLLIEEARRQVASAVRLAAVRAMAGDRLVEIGADLVTSRRQWRDVLAARVTSGLSAPVDRDAAEVDLRLAEIELTKARALAAARWAELKAAAGLDPASPLTLASGLEEVVGAIRRTPIADPQAGGSLTLARPDVREADAAIAVAVAREHLARQDGKLDVSFDATYMHSLAGFPQLGLTAAGAPEPIRNRMNEVMFGATVMLPARNRNQGAIAAAEAGIRAMTAERDARVIGAHAEIESARARDAEAGRALEIWSGGLLPLAAQNLSVARQSYEIGRATRFEVLSEERRYLELQAAYVAALTEGYEARVILAQALGGAR
jgi:cobalt-zinc-cadmium efflux system outer membrane protein